MSLTPLVCCRKLDGHVPSTVVASAVCDHREQPSVSLTLLIAIGSGTGSGERPESPRHQTLPHKSKKLLSFGRYDEVGYWDWLERGKTFAR
jgi:hypothetical protein